MKTIFSKLYQLQNVFGDKYKRLDEIENLPQALNDKENVMERLLAKQLDAQSKLERFEKQLLEIKRERNETNARKQEIEMNVEKVENQREYEALDREIQDNNDKSARLRVEGSRVEKDLENIKEQIEINTELLESTESELSALREEIHAKITTREDQIENLNKKIDEISEGIDKEILFKFDRIIKNKKNKGLVPLSNGYCSGCNMILSANFINEVRKQNEIYFCPYCSRVLYYEDNAQNSMIDFGASDDGEGNDNSLNDFMDDDLNDEDEIGGLADLAVDIDFGDFDE